MVSVPKKSAKKTAKKSATKSPKKVPDQWGEPPEKSDDIVVVRAELERLRRYSARLQQKREEAVRGALASEHAVQRAKEERDVYAREERARASRCSFASPRRTRGSLSALLYYY